MTKKRVSFAPQPVSAVHTVPADGRGLEPGLKARMQRVRALKRVHGLRVTAAKVNAQFGERGRPVGSRGTYTAKMARRNLWHAAKGGGPWYRPVTTTDGKLEFVSPFTPRETTELVSQMAADLLAGRVRL